MKQLLLAPLFCAALAAAPCFAQTPPSVPLPADIDRVLKDYERAWSANDAPALTNLFLPDGMALPGGQPPARGAEQIRKAYSHGGAMPTYLRAIDYAVSGDMAYIAGGYGPVAAKEDMGKFVLVLRRVDGRWLIAADIENANMQMRPAPRPAKAAAPAAQG
ncbi:YybH family protein [Massilia cavernae]|uniref:DUF4440 domain-containing protein n=1 Tax=Massilia cavernae TaxID=2320864 RepID=A0A418XSC5_9BURK|nr:DUF4440 domain-containing protein [Massilia cavernae]RJG15386.1 DUF4440 domain-containing protein [Massilia cavernae]